MGQLRAFGNEHLRLAKGAGHARMLHNIRDCLERGLPEIAPAPPNETEIAICGFGPSIQETWQDAFRHEQQWAINGALDFMVERGRKPSHCFLMCPGKVLNRYVTRPHEGVVYYVASQCDPQVFDTLKGCDVRVFHAYQGPMRAFNLALQKLGIWDRVHGLGSHAVLRAMCLAREVLGIKRMHIYGADASQREKEYHPGEDIDTDMHEIIDIECAGRWFKSMRPYASQCEQMEWLLNNHLKDADVSFYGDGLMQWYFQAGAAQQAIEQRATA